MTEQQSSHKKLPSGRRLPREPIPTVQLTPASTVPMMTGLPKMPNPTAVQSEVVAHEIALRPLTSAGNDCAVQAYPSLTEARTEFDSHGEAIGGGGARDRIQPPCPRWRSLRCPRQPTRRRTHDRRASSRVAGVPHGDAVFGRRTRDPSEINGISRRTLRRPTWSHCSMCPLTYGIELKFVPTPIQVVLVRTGDGDRVASPLGIEVVVCQLRDVRSTVLDEVAPPPLATPTPHMLSDVEHETHCQRHNRWLVQGCPSSSIMGADDCRTLIDHANSRRK